jgi:hypothetical protein
MAFEVQFQRSLCFAESDGGLPGRLMPGDTMTNRTRGFFSGTENARPQPLQVFWH